MNQAYPSLESLFRRVANYQHLQSMVSWDQAVNMPAGGVEARASALAEISGLIQSALCSHEMHDAILGAEQESSKLSPWQRANVREARRTYDGLTAVDPALLEKKSKLEVTCEYAWRRCRQENDWKGFLPHFRPLFALIREEAVQRGAKAGLSPYDALLDLYQPGLSMALLSSWFPALKSFLKEFIPQCLERQKASPDLDWSGRYPVEAQRAMGLELMKAMGFDFTRGRLDTSTHPFCGGVPTDVRITTRFSEDECVQSMMGVIHETGHALYEQHLPRDWAGQPVGYARGMAVHESQSLFMEMQIACSRPFVEFLHGRFAGHFPALAERRDFTPETLYRSITRVEPGLIRVEADEVTYPLHVILRYEIESALIDGSLAAEDIPGAWNERMKAFLGIDTSGNDRQGCLQDIHWPSGALGYFPSYTVGAMIAAQLRASIDRDVANLDADLARGDLSGAKAWLLQNVWSQGSVHEGFQELCQAATGSPLDPKHFIDHLRRRYG